MKQFKIFKYPVHLNEVQHNYFAWIPEGSRVLRVAHVDDGFYKGDFLWAIVDLDQKSNLQPFDLRDSTNPLSGLTWHEDLIFGWPKISPALPRVQLSVKEKQTICVPGVPVRAGEEDGKIYVYYNPTDWDPRTKHLEDGIEYQIAVFKTGQLIDVPIEKLQYLGLNRLWIIQELGLYSFTITAK